MFNMSRRGINYHNMHRLSNKDARKAEGCNMGSNPVLLKSTHIWFDQEIRSK
jgi:hypothetical protein